MEMNGIDTFDSIYEYVGLLQSIALYQFDADDIQTPYAFEMKRKELHENLFREHILPHCNPTEGFTEQDMYARTKDIFANLDKVWAIYDASEFDLKDDSCVTFLCRYLEKLLSSTEAVYYIEGRTKHIHGIV